MEDRIERLQKIIGSMIEEACSLKDTSKSQDDYFEYLGREKTLMEVRDIIRCLPEEEQKDV